MQNKTADAGGPRPAGPPGFSQHLEKLLQESTSKTVKQTHILRGSAFPLPREGPERAFLFAGDGKTA